MTWIVNIDITLQTKKIIYKLIFYQMLDHIEGDTDEDGRYKVS